MKKSCYITRTDRERKACRTIEKTKKHTRTEKLCYE